MAALRRGIGIRGVKQTREAQANLLAVGEQVERTKSESIRSQMDVFKRSLEEFAVKYKKEINRNPAFRMHFQRMCSDIGVDTLASRQGFWAQLLGLGDFYYELSVQIVDVCLATRKLNGGLIRMAELKARLQRRRGAKAQEITEDDIERAIAKLRVLGNGFWILVLGTERLVQSVPVELNVDHSAVLALASESAKVSKSGIRAALGWTPDRIDSVLNVLMQEGMVWVDDQGPEPEYWVLSLVRDAR
eukprot:a511698_494.p1 GENE.a511698_494~~a511698_494.p1  ORF type:complete len:262 (+),score=85.63 a511698_494:49-786(+)